MAPVDGIPHQFCITMWQQGRLPKSGIRVMIATLGFYQFGWRDNAAHARMPAVIELRIRTGNPKYE
jgi:hypothetical protein